MALNQGPWRFLSLEGGALRLPPLTHTRRTVWNLLGQGLPLAVSVVSVPVLVRHLGEARFGVLGLAWALAGYFSVMDLGLGRSTTKFVAQSLSRRKHQLAARVASLGLLTHAALGAGAAALLAGFSGWLVQALIGSGGEVAAEALGAFYWVAWSLPFVLLAAGLRAVLEGGGRFDVVNLIRIPASSLNFLLAAVVAALGYGLETILAWLLVLRVATCALSFAIVPKVIPGLRWSLRGDGVPLGELARYSAWVGLANLINPFVFHFDRFLLGAMKGVVAVAHYTAPFELVTRMLILPGAASGALFPTFSAVSLAAASGGGRASGGSTVSAGSTVSRGGTASGEGAASKGGTGSGEGAASGKGGLQGDGGGWRLMRRSVWVVGVVLALPAAVLVVFADELLHLWLGAGFAAEAAGALRILAVGVLVNGLAHMPYSYLQGVGRPDLPTKFLLLELPVYVFAAWVLVGRFGPAGAAAAWSLRVTLDAVLVFWAAYRVGAENHRVGKARAAPPAGLNRLDHT